MSQSILDYFLNKNGLLNSNGAQSSQLPSRAIPLANKEVASVFQQNDNSMKCLHGAYNREVNLEHYKELAYN